MEKTQEDNLRAVGFAAGTLLVVACLQRAAVVSMVEQGRVWVFLTINLLLLAILFTSTSPKTSVIHQERDSEVQNKMNDFERDTGRKQCRRSLVLTDEDRHCGGRVLKEPKTGGGDDGAAKSTDDRQLSKEELNKKVEAFIAMFRQQLVSDPCSARSKQHFT